jgi:hypothetical protein
VLNNSKPLIVAAGVFTAVFVMAVLAVILISGGGDSGGSAANEPPPAATEEPPPAASGPAEQALARYVQTTLNKGFVEDCAKSQAATDAGKLCSIFRGERGNQRAYVLGLVASEPSQWAILENQGGNWQVVHSPAITRDNSAVPGVPWPLQRGVDVVVAGAAPCVNVREGPAISTRAVDCIADGARIKLAAGPVTADNYQWWQVEGRSGWVVSEYLRFPDAAQ